MMTRELDALVAEKVMGAYWTERKNVCRILWNADDEEMILEEWYEKDWVPSNAPLPCYSTSIADAWIVVEKMNGEGWYVDISHDLIAWSVIFAHADNPKDKFVHDWKNSLPKQICKAALKAVGHDI